MIRVGFPGWKLLARLGLPLRVQVAVHFDDESKTLWADSPDLPGLAVAGDTLQELLHEAEAAAQVLVALQLGREEERHHAIITQPRLAYPEAQPA